MIAPTKARQKDNIQSVAATIGRHIYPNLRIFWRPMGAATGAIVVMGFSGGRGDPPLQILVRWVVRNSGDRKGRPYIVRWWIFAHPVGATLAVVPCAVCDVPCCSVGAGPCARPLVRFPPHVDGSAYRWFAKNSVHRPMPSPTSGWGTARGG